MLTRRWQAAAAAAVGPEPLPTHPTPRLPRPPSEFDRERTIIQRCVASRPMFLDLSDEVAGRGASAAGKYDVAAQIKPLRTLLRCGAGLPSRCWAAAGLLTTPSCGR